MVFVPLNSHNRDALGFYNSTASSSSTNNRHLQQLQCEQALERENDNGDNNGDDSDTNGDDSDGDISFDDEDNIEVYYVGTAQLGRVFPPGSAKIVDIPPRRGGRGAAAAATTNSRTGDAGYGSGSSNYNYNNSNINIINNTNNNHNRQDHHNYHSPLHSPHSPTNTDYHYPRPLPPTPRTSARDVGSLPDLRSARAAHAITTATATSSSSRRRCMSLREEEAASQGARQPAVPLLQLQHGHNGVLNAIAGPTAANTTPTRPTPSSASAATTAVRANERERQQLSLMEALSDESMAPREGWRTASRDWQQQKLTTAKSSPNLRRRGPTAAIPSSPIPEQSSSNSRGRMMAVMTPACELPSLGEHGAGSLMGGGGNDDDDDIHPDAEATGAPETKGKKQRKKFRKRVASGGKQFLSDVLGR